MTILTTFFALCYLSAGGIVWHQVVLHNVTLVHVGKCRTQDDLNTIIENQSMMQASERAFSAAHMICKGAFILAWPLWLLAGLVAARVLQ